MSFKLSAEGLVFPPKTANKYAAITFIFSSSFFFFLQKKKTNKKPIWITLKP